MHPRFDYIHIETIISHVSNRSGKKMCTLEYIRKHHGGRKQCITQFENIFSLINETRTTPGDGIASYIVYRKHNTLVTYPS